MVENHPLVSIGLPIYNGEQYIDEVIKCILSQTYNNIELIIIDNASIDNTKKICLKYAVKDNRIKYYRNHMNIGVNKNHCKVFSLAKGKYFKWAAHDDLMSSDYIEKCVKVLEEKPTIILCFTKAYLIDEKGEVYGRYEYHPNISSNKPHKRYSLFLGFSHHLYCLSGLIRSDTLRKTKLIEDFIYSDRNLCLDLSLLGRFYQIPEYNFFFRYHPGSYSYQVRHSKFQESYITWWNSLTKRSRRIIYTINIAKFLSSIIRFPLKPSERILCTFMFIKWLFIEGWIKILEDFEFVLLGKKSIFSYISYTFVKILVELPHRFTPYTHIRKTYGYG